MKNNIKYDVQIKEMYDDIHYILRRTCDVSQLPDEKQKELYSKMLDVWYILFHNQNLTNQNKD